MESHKNDQSERTAGTRRVVHVTAGTDHRPATEQLHQQGKDIPCHLDWAPDSERPTGRRGHRNKRGEHTEQTHGWPKNVLKSRAAFFSLAFAMLHLGRLGSTLRVSAAVSPALRRCIPALAIAPRELSTLTESFLNGSNSVYADEMYKAWAKDPARCDLKPPKSQRSSSCVF
jgi:hypothetical protein